jgi:hypothetical protein
LNINRKLNQTAVYWAPLAPGNDGNVTWGAGAEISVRWENKREVFTNFEGEEKTSSAIVYSNGDETTQVENGRLYLGELTDLTAPQQANPEIVLNSFRIQQSLLSPNVRATQHLRKNWL